MWNLARPIAVATLLACGDSGAPEGAGTESSSTSLPYLPSEHSAIATSEDYPGPCAYCEPDECCDGYGCFYCPLGGCYVHEDCQEGYCDDEQTVGGGYEPERYGCGTAPRVPECRIPPVVLDAPVELVFGPTRALRFTDADDDGLADLVLASDDGLRMLTATGTLTEPASYQMSGIPKGLEISNIDDDADNEILVHLRNTVSSLVVFHASSPTELRRSLLVAGDRRWDDFDVGDFDGDGNVDVVASGGQEILLYLSNGAGDFILGPSGAGEPTGPALLAADYDGDGRTDLFHTSEAEQQPWLLVSAGSDLMRLPDPGTRKPRMLTAADLDGDDVNDLIAFDQHTEETLFASWRGSNLERRPYEVLPDVVTSIASSDFNGDGREDVVMAHDDSFSIALAGNGDRVFDCRWVFDTEHPARWIAVEHDESTDEYVIAYTDEQRTTLVRGQAP